MLTAEIRSLFLEYFRELGHDVVPSASLIPHNDPTLLFTNAGMIPFKNVFTGEETRPYTRASSCQKCIRAGGKHNDLENVGHTARHHTFFEMLGNFSFGDYFKKDAIEFAWNFLTKKLEINPKRLLITVYADDDEAFDLWRQVAGVPEQKIIRIAEKEENFWTMGDTGPCGPCSEIFYDHGPDVPGGPPGSPDAEGDRFVEIWNLVFMQFDQKADGKMVPLPKPSIDTGMGIERIAAVMQGVHNNYDTDIFKDIIEVSVDLTKVAAEGGSLVSHRVVADHLRSCSFLVADGVLPSNEGRGYVLRRIMRRAMRHAQMLGYKGALLADLVPALVDKMGVAYPELVRAAPLITEIFTLEDKRFHQTLEKGLKILNEASYQLEKGQALSGDIAFKLYDTYGFPLDLTEDVLKAEQKTVDHAGFEAAMGKQKAEARAAWSGSGETKEDQLWLDVCSEILPTEFLGYDSTSGQGMIQAFVKDGESASAVNSGDQVAVILNQSPFYGESGGQIGDSGFITSSGGGKIRIEDTLRKAGGVFIHMGTVLEGSFKLDEEVHLEVDAERRTLLMGNHSATHLLHTALRKILGDHVIQKGSLVAPDRLRFDFSHVKAMSPEEIRQVEREVNDQVRKNAPSSVRVMTPEDAQEVGALALFGEKYGDEVRVVAMGEAEPGKPYSVELCGGTHCEETGEIGFFKIIGEAGIAAGVRRIEALTGPSAEDYVSEQEVLIQSLAKNLKAQPVELAEKIEQLMLERRRLEKEVQTLRQQAALGGGAAGPAESDIESVNGVSFTSRQLAGVPAKDLKPIVDDLKSQLKSGVVVVASDIEGKASLVIGVTEDLTSKLSAVDLIRKASPSLGGQGGGGRPDMAQAGGPDPSGIPGAIDAVRAALS